MPIVTTARTDEITTIAVYPNMQGQSRVIIHTASNNAVSFSLDELERINKVVSVYFADLAEPLPDFPGDIPSLAEQESQEV